MDKKHIPVLQQEVLQLLKPKPGDRYLDLTAGYGGHAQLVAEMIGLQGSLTLVDRDPEAITHIKKTFASSKHVKFFQTDFLSAGKKLLEQGKKFDVILADLGISSVQVDEPARGFSFNKDGPIDMRMDTAQNKTAADIVNSATEAELTKVFLAYGEQKGANKLAKKIVQHRPYHTTKELANSIASASTGGWKKIHPATKVFQALRIAVNDELYQIEASLPIWIDLLDTGGRIGVISFHSLEDRLVKQAFQEYGGERYDATLQAVSKKVIRPSSHEIVFNPRSRSAKLRVAQRK